MDTKWNNAIDNGGNFIEEKKEEIVGAVFIVSGLSLECQRMQYSCSFGESIANWLFATIFLASGLVLISWKKLKNTYDKQMLNKDYNGWKKEFVKMEKRTLLLFILALSATVISAWLFYGTWLFVVTILVIYIVFQIFYIWFMHKYLDAIMTQADELNRQNLEIALEKASRSDRLRMDLITNVSHDLKTPITSMVGYLELMKKEELSPVVKDYVEVIFDKTDKLKEMIESLFSLAKVSSGNIELHKETFQFNRLIEQIMADMKDRTSESELHFVMKLTEEDTEIVSDNMYCYRICQNLLENALKYSAKGTRVFVKTYLKEDGMVCLEMTNTASYLMDFDKEEIMERFVRGDKARSTEGNGLGLAIVSSYANALGGSFDIQIDCDQFKAYLYLPRK